MRLIDLHDLRVSRANPDAFENREYAIGWNNAIQAMIETSHTIDPENLPIVQSLRAKVYMQETNLSALRDRASRLEAARENANEACSKWEHKCNDYKQQISENTQTIKDLSEETEKWKKEAESQQDGKIHWKQKSEMLQDMYYNVVEEITHILRNDKKVVTSLKYYLDINEEDGVVHIPKFMVERLISHLVSNTASNY